MKPNLKVFILLSFTIIGLILFDYLLSEHTTLNLKPLYLFTSLKKEKPLDLPVREVLNTISTKKEELDAKKITTTISAQIETPKQPIVLSSDSIPLLEDFSPDHINLQILNSNLKGLSHDSTAFRIAYFGDSFIEGDILTSDFRDTLQRLYGGEGVGMVPLASPIAGFRKTVWSASQGFTILNINDAKTKSMVGIEGQSFKIDSQNARVQYVLHSSIKSASVKIFYSTQSTVYFKYSSNSLKEVKDSLVLNEGLQVWHKTFDNLSRVRFVFPKSNTFILYGISMDGRNGIQVDNFSIRGNSGYGLLALNEHLLTQFSSLLPYKLVIVHFGLNVASPANNNYAFYIAPMKKVIDKIKRAFPGCIVLIASVNDRSQRIQGNMQTLPSIPFLVNAQRKLAFETQSLFWNVYESMGGQNSMVRWADSKPALANKDYTHINFLGGKRLGRQLARLLLNQKDNDKSNSSTFRDTVLTKP